MWRCAKEPIEGFDAVAVGQEEVDQYRRDAVRSLLYERRFPAQSVHTLGTASDPFDVEGPIARVDECVSNGIGIRRIVLDQEYVLRDQQPAAIKVRRSCPSFKGPKVPATVR